MALNDNFGFIALRAVMYVAIYMPMFPMMSNIPISVIIHKPMNSITDTLQMILAHVQMSTEIKAIQNKCMFTTLCFMFVMEYTFVRYL